MSRPNIEMMRERYEWVFGTEGGPSVDYQAGWSQEVIGALLDYVVVLEAKYLRHRFLPAGHSIATPPGQLPNCLRCSKPASDPIHTTTPTDPEAEE